MYCAGGSASYRPDEVIFNGLTTVQAGLVMIQAALQPRSLQAGEAAVRPNGATPASCDRRPH
jgi:hypothetical protein